MRRDPPTGTVTFLFTDVEGSTKLLHELGAEGYAETLAEHRRILREAIRADGGVEVDTQGDAFFVAFPTAPGALNAARAIIEHLEAGPITVRIGLHTGTPLLTDGGYVGGDVHRAARIAAAGHGGQVLVSASAAQLVEIDLTDLGEHRLKDLSAPERIYQLGGRPFPALKSLYRTNLPVPTTPFIGRESELAEVLLLLSGKDTRLLTLTGPGGTGKTRLALQAAAAASGSFPDGIWWVPLAPLRDPKLVLGRAAQALGAKNGLAEHIADQRLLLLFDNFEQVVEAATNLAGLLASCPNVALLVTSRERLRVRGEQTYPVPPLAETDGAALFIARARAVNPSFAESKAVGELCIRLDELPLALELAAARTALFSPEQLLDRLSQRLDLLKGGRDADPRQRTLRATIEWSYDLLTEEEQELFGRLSVFAGSCSYEAAELVAGAEPDALQSLLDKSLLRKRESAFGPRLWMLETIREFAAERLQNSGETEGLVRRHAEHFLGFVEEAEPNLLRDSLEWVDRLEREHDNLRVALDRLEASGESQMTLRLAGAVWRFWYLKSHLSEGQRRLENAVRADERPTAARAKALNGLAVMALNIGHAPKAQLLAKEALELHRTLGDTWGAAYSAFMVGNAIAEGGDAVGAKPLLAESVREFRELGDEHYALIASTNLAWVTGDSGDPEGERTLHEDNLRRARELSDERLQAGSLAQLAMFARDDGNLQDACSMLRAALRIEHDQGSVLDVAVNLGRLASVLALAGTVATAARLLSSSEALTLGLGASVPFWAKDRNEKTLAIIRAKLDEPTLGKALEQGRRLSVDEAVALAMDA